MPKKPDTIASLAKEIAKAAQAEAPAHTAAVARADAEKDATYDAYCRAAGALGDARGAEARNKRRAEAAAALARLGDRPDLIDLMFAKNTLPEEISAFVRRGLMTGSRHGARGTTYYWTILGRDVIALAAELRDRLPAPE